MQALIGRVKRNGAFAKDGSIEVEVSSKDRWVKARYVSPYGGSPDHGIVAIPEIDDTVIIMQADNDRLNEWYYMGSVWGKQLVDGKYKNNFTKGDNYNPDAPMIGTFPDDKIYKARGVPQRMVWRSPRGNKLTLSDQGNPGMQNYYAQLKSPTGKALTLNDSGNVDATILKNQWDDGIVIQGRWLGARAPRMIQLRSWGPIRLISTHNGILIKSQDGNEIDIINKSSGRTKSTKHPEPGNINIRSNNYNINLIVDNIKNTSSKVNIITNGNNGEVNVTTKGSSSKINVKSEGSVSISADSDVSIKADSDVSINGENVNITAKDSINLSAKE